LTFADFFSHKNPHNFVDDQKILKLVKMKRSVNNLSDQLMVIINNEEGYVCQSNGYLYRFKFNSTSLDILQEKLIFPTSKLFIR
jgi:hypothetical protein